MICPECQSLSYKAGTISEYGVKKQRYRCGNNHYFSQRLISKDCYTEDFKSLIVSKFNKGVTVPNLSKEHGVSQQTIWNWVKKGVYLDDRSI